CIAAKRFLVADSLYGEFSRRYTEAFRTRVSGDPMLPSTDIGPLARPDLAQELAAQVKESVRLGAVLLCGGEYDSSNKDNAFYPPTVLANVRPGMPAFDQEMFGPVAALIRVHNEEEAIGLANQSRFGLGSGVFTRDPERALRVASRLQAGNCAINDFVRSDPRLPFGGVKESGYGRELSHLGLREFTNIQSVLIG
ncbi:MAG TPA: aldehyde dehydrogenase family protein, partial [Pseudohongiella sp.]|nr:aldehyde dehydrogenase family protein [Pseudohongiella sp.]